MNQNVNGERFEPNEEVVRLYEEEGRRTGRQDQRYDEEIVRDEAVISFSASVIVIAENMRKLASDGS
jgi:hypothetical protein